MAYDFPNAPTVNQVYDKWKWDGTAWVLAAGGSLPSSYMYGFFSSVTFPAGSGNGSFQLQPTGGVAVVPAADYSVNTTTGMITFNKGGVYHVGYTINFQLATPNALPENWVDTGFFQHPPAPTGGNVDFVQCLAPVKNALGAATAQALFSIPPLGRAAVYYALGSANTSVQINGGRVFATRIS